MPEVREALAQALHEAYVRERLESGEERGSTPSLVSWSELAEEYRESSRRNAADIQEIVSGFGYELRPVGSAETAESLTEPEVEAFAERLHERWVEERAAGGWRLGERRDDGKRLHPDLVPWNELPEERREIDRNMGRELPEIAGSAGLVLSRRP